jgi:hypothetical protein
METTKIVRDMATIRMVDAPNINFVFSFILIISTFWGLFYERRVKVYPSLIVQVFDIALSDFPVI